MVAVFVMLVLGASPLAPARASATAAATMMASASPPVWRRKFSGTWNLNHWDLGKAIDFLVPLGAGAAGLAEWRPQGADLI